MSYAQLGAWDRLSVRVRVRVRVRVGEVFFFSFLG